MFLQSVRRFATLLSGKGALVGGPDGVALPWIWSASLYSA
jgi:hypothetical protein